jgi:hypothetical protein
LSSPEPKTREIPIVCDSEIVEPQRFPPDLLDRARTAIARDGFCIFASDELERLFSRVSASYAARERALQEFADACGSAVETNRHFTSARFIRPA